MVYRSPGKNSLKKRSQRGIILGVSEEVKGFRVYVMDDKKVVTTQHVKYIETLSRAQIYSLLRLGNDCIDASVDGAGLVTAAHQPMGGASESLEPTTAERMPPSSSLATSS